MKDQDQVLTKDEDQARGSFLVQFNLVGLV